MKKILFIFGSIASINSFAATGWTTYVINNSNSDIVFGNASSSSVISYSNQSKATWNLGDLISSITVPAHSTGSFYTEENEPVAADGSQTIEKTLQFAASYNDNSKHDAIPIKYIVNSLNRLNNSETATVVANTQSYTTPGKYNFATGCVKVKMTFSEDNQLNLNNVDYGDHKDCR